MTSCSYHYAGNERRELRYQSPIRRLETRIQFPIHLAFFKYIGSRDIEDGLLGLNLERGYQHYGQEYRNDQGMVRRNAPAFSALRSLKSGFLRLFLCPIHAVTSANQ